MIALLAREAAAPGSLRALKRGLRVQIRVIAALMIRDGMSRFGRENIGFFWTIAQPLFLTIGVMILWSIGHSKHGALGIIPFALSGYTFLTLWRTIVNKSIGCMTNNANLAFHQQVQFFDVLIARGLMEVVSVFTAFMVGYIPLWMLGYVPTLNDPLLLVAGWLCTGWFSISFGLILAAVSELSEVLEHLIHPVLYLTLPITGAFTMQAWLPDSAANVLAWSPLVNCAEMFRGGLFAPSQVVTHWSLSYVLTVCIIQTAIGVAACRYAQTRVQLL